ncbi:uncharacterized protein LOC113852030 [Abrus precatorius]|uniref:Uncharacterized protein LOC113852030 n=1 Tax=Abrus precatorius TaxID=3816 RepID=A0A8B8K4T5_ABRPR|nr:uncharacterized protein LOC113852030 [Abrus precatorius]
MTRSRSKHLFDIDPEIDRTYHRLQRGQSSVHHSSSDRSHSREHCRLDLSNDSYFSDSEFGTSISDTLSTHSDTMAHNNHERTLKELAAPDVTYQPLGIQYLDIDVPFELKSGLIHLLPKFNGSAGEDPHKHLKEFHIVCSTMRPQGVPEDHIKLKAFPFSLDGAAKDWLYYLQPGSVTCWIDMKRMFLQKFFPASRAATIRTEISGIRQISQESLYEYWERFKKLCATCPHHQISDQLLIQYIYEGLAPMERSMLDAASGGALMDKTPSSARALIDNMVENSQQFSIRAMTPMREVHNVHQTNHMPAENRLESRIKELTTFVRQLAVAQQVAPQRPRDCQICSSIEHASDCCPLLQEGNQQASVQGVFSGRQDQYRASNFQQQQMRQQHPYRFQYQSHNPAFNDHPNMRYGASEQQQGTGQASGAYRPPPMRQQQQNFEPSLEDLVKQMAKNNLQFQQNVNASIQDLQTQIGQLATTVNQFKSQGSG